MPYECVNVNTVFTCMWTYIHAKVYIRISIYIYMFVWVYMYMYTLYMRIYGFPWRIPMGFVTLRIRKRCKTCCEPRMHMRLLLQVLKQRHHQPAWFWGLLVSALLPRPLHQVRLPSLFHQKAHLRRIAACLGWDGMIYMFIYMQMLCASYIFTFMYMCEAICR